MEKPEPTFWPTWYIEIIYFLSFLKFIYLFIFGGCVWVFIAAHGLSLVAASGGYSSLRCTDFSLRWLLLLWSTGSRCAGFSSCGTWALEHRLSSRGTWALLLHGMWDLPGPGLEPVSPALAGSFVTTGLVILNSLSTWQYGPWVRVPCFFIMPRFKGSQDLAHL